MATSISNNAFITVWKTNNVGTSSDTQITLPLNSLGTYNFFVEWGDGSTDTITSYNQPEVTHTYPEAGTYEVKIYGTCNGFRFGNGGDKLKILEVKQWGATFKSTTIYPFWGCTNLIITSTDRLVTTGTLLYMFFGSNIGNVRNMGRWDVSSNTTFLNAFRSCVNFNSNIDGWDVSNVTTLNSMLHTCTNFNQPLNSWDISNVSVLASMFTNCANFNQNLNNWNTSKVNSMTNLFFGCTKFNGRVDGWDLSLVTSLSSVFFTCANFNQPLNSWNVSNVTTFLNFLNGCTNFNQPLDNWDTSSANNMSQMFRNSPSFDQSLASWDITSVTNMSNMFLGAGISTENYDATLISWAAQAVQSNVSFHAGSSKYTAGGEAEAARNILINTYNWTIVDGGSI